MTQESAERPADGGRQEILSHLRRQLIGPADGAGEMVEEPPNRRYSMGVLYPTRIAMDSLEKEEMPDVSGAVSGPRSSDDDPIRMATEWFPSSAGVSFQVASGSDLEVSTCAARYDQVSGKPRRWAHRWISPPDDPETLVVSGTQASPHRVDVLDGAALLDIRRRPRASGDLITVTLINAEESSSGGAPDASECLYQVALECRPTSGPLMDYPAPALAAAESEEADLRLLYRASTTYAVGHGCAAAWSGDNEGQVDSVRVEFLPTVDVPPITQAAEEQHDVLSLSYLADAELDTVKLASGLHSFVDEYADWRSTLSEAAKDLPPRLQGPAERTLSRIDKAEQRMRSGIRVLVQEELVLDAFRNAQLVMAMQMRHSADDLAGSSHRRSEPDPRNIGYDKLPYRWYPFQLAFQLLVLESLADADSGDRDVVDLLWFPTGGGKTEAYLAVATTEMFLRRLRFGDRGGGTTVLTRYTLRLLTTQQFQRSATMICAAELVRRELGLGSEPFSLGLWVGGETTPNECAEAAEKAQRVLDDSRPRNPFPLQRCPWCGTAIVPDKASSREHYGFATDPCLTFYCPTPHCPFQNSLPISIVDEEQYREPPTFLLATIDKLARLPWLDGPTAFFGTSDRMGPSLIIQDELHLLTGPLGTTFGLYEHAIEEAIRLRSGAPKVLASTATIRRADEQSTALFGRPIDLFPPAGLSADDSYFARWDRSRPGRTYVGLMTPAHTVATALVHAASALLESVGSGDMTHEERDAYWTLVVYHNSLRELGRTMTLARDDIPARMAGMSMDEATLREVNDENVVELTGNVGGAAIPGILNRLERGIDSEDPIAVLCSTNMLSVGVDVSRLGLMLVNGQPKQSSEYIQATSRVGRSAVPGLVVSLLSAARPRDRSHYENFVPFHEALYRHVEPTSVTPFSLPSRMRALHASLAILARHGLGLGGNDGANQLTVEHESAIREAMVGAVEEADPLEREALETHLDSLLEDWRDRIDAAASEGKRLYYRADGAQSHGLLMDYGSMGRDWPTLHSMRNVDREARIGVLGEEWGSSG